MSTKPDILVVGAGPAGLMAAITAATTKASVTLLEKMPRPARKLGISGKGRGNLTNTADLKSFLQHFNNSGRFLKHAFSRFFNNDLIKFFTDHGLPTVTERGGRVFTASGKATDAVRCLHEAAQKCGVKMVLETPVRDLIISDNNCEGVITESAKSHYARATIVCTGGLSYPLTGSTGDGLQLAGQYGHDIVTPLPSLVALKPDILLPTDIDRLSLRNISATLRINEKKAAEESGEVTFLDGCLAGPIIITLSRIAVPALADGHKIAISLDLKPALSHRQIDNRILREIAQNPALSFSELLRKLLPAELIRFFCGQLAINGKTPVSALKSDQRRLLRNLLKEMNFKIIGHAPWSQAIITAGGISTRQVSPLTMESKLIRNLYFAGEILDIDADTGGFNLQAAFSTGWLAGFSAAGKICENNLTKWELNHETDCQTT